MKGCNSGLVFIPVNNAGESNALQKGYKKPRAKLRFYVDRLSGLAAVVVNRAGSFLRRGFTEGSFNFYSEM